MIGHFPIPYDDELLYSACARFADRMNYPTPCSVSFDLTGKRQAAAVIDLPAHLAYFIDALPPLHPLMDERRLIYFNTLFPFYQGFLPLVRQSLLWHRMLSGEATPSLLINNHVPSPPALQFCQKCVQADRQRYGECYWHRTHQLPGIFFCPIHATPLWQSEVLTTPEQKYHREYISAERAIGAMSSTCLQVEPGHTQTLLSIAQNAQWLLNNGYFVGGPEITQQRYHFLLIKRGLATEDRIHGIQQFQPEFQNHFPPGLLTLLHSDLPDTPHNWLAQLVRPDERAQHPLRHLLLLDYFGLSVAEFLRVPVEYLPFGLGPWRCWKPRTNHFGQRTITECKLIRERGNKYTGIFTCPLCGDSVKWHDPDQTPFEQYEASMGTTFGPTWEERLQRLWRNPRVAPDELVIRLEVDIQTLITEAQRLMPGIPPAGAVPRKGRQPIPIEKRRTEMRQKWLKLRRENPYADSTTLNIIGNHTYVWLSKHDRDWLEQNLPPRQNSAHNRTTPWPTYVDWPARDSLLAHKIQVAAQQIRAQPGKPERITRTALQRQVKLLRLSTYALNRLPQTKRALAEETEIPEDIALRRIAWAETEFRRENFCPSRSKFMTKAGVTHHRGVPEIMDAVDAALNRLSRMQHGY